ncbi:putative sporulation protein YtxC [Caldanaerobius polysaccharolyticus]|uniref:putative sporulation protein YtxC n=1 Tax=Caldanaerobius polysaccharolyticus TaxID=44256 RepID=UPI00068B03F3|nr:putative sporulation protein YtxC [Caldanaerobius polysaccharolyticus]
MHNGLTVMIPKDAIPVIDSFIEEIDMLKKRGLKVDYTNSVAGDNMVFVCTVKDKDEHRRDIFRQYMANILADIIIKHWEIKFIDKIIHKNYNYFSSEERFKILKNVYNILSEDNADFYWINKKAEIVNAMLEYFNTSDVLNLKGFVNFRLKEYISGLYDVVDRAVDDYLVEREYNEFIKLLKYFVELQESQYNIVHVLVSDDMRYVLIDENYKEIDNHLVESQGYLNRELSNEDVLISSLITIAPNRIYFHCSEAFDNDNFIGTLKSVFGEKVVICTGCDICNKVNSICKK